MIKRLQTIHIFQPDGSPRSVKIAEITNRVVKAVLAPRNKLDYINSREELNNVGLYFLFGESTDGLKPMVYIGEAEDCLSRLKQHNRKKEFWNYAVAMISKINAFTKAHVKYLEYTAVAIAKEVNRYETENVSIPNKPFVTESMEADLLDSFETIKILLSTLGFPVFDKVEKGSETDDLFYIKTKHIKAEGKLTDEGFVVFKGSQVRQRTTPSCLMYLMNLRDKLIDNNIISEQKGYYYFNQDYIFNSPSTAGGVILGRSTNGWTKWETKAGVSLDALKRQ